MFKKFVIGLINLYQRYLSFDTGVLQIFSPSGACRHELRCSEYAKQEIDRSGIIKGSWRGFKRVLTCF